MRIIFGAILGSVLALSPVDPVDAKTIREVDGPAETPPLSYTSRQYVDSRGCVFIRAGYGGRVTWVPRVNRKRQVYCSKQNKPSLSSSQLAALGSIPVVVKTDPNDAVEHPVKKKPVAITNTEVEVVKKKVVRKAAIQRARKGKKITVAAVQDTQYRLSANGSRIDPDVTKAGDAQMNLIWTQTVPRRLIEKTIKIQRVASVSVTTSVSSKNLAGSSAIGVRYVQVGVFGEPANASRTISRFQAQGLPVASRKFSSNGKSYKSVLLGPFKDSAGLQAAMTAARKAGFSDAVYK